MRILSVADATGPDRPAGLQRLTYISAVDGCRDWCLFRKGTGHPELWLVVLHGHGAVGDQLFTRPDLRETWLPTFLRSGAGLVCPNLRGNAWMGPAAATDLHDLLEFLRAEQGLRRTLFVSGSMGGTGNLIYAVLHPEDVDGVIARGVATDLGSYWAWCRERPEPILGEIAAAIEASYGGTPETAPTVYRRHSALHHAARLSMPLHLSHGGADAVIPVDQARALAARLGHRSTFVYREIPGGNHDSPLTETESFPLIWARIMGM